MTLIDHIVERIAQTKRAREASQEMGLAKITMRGNRLTTSPTFQQTIRKYSR